jgi:hypothetical protein
MMPIRCRAHALLPLLTLSVCLAPAGCDQADDAAVTSPEPVVSAAIDPTSCNLRSPPGAPRAVRAQSISGTDPATNRRLYLVDWDPPVGVLLGTDCNPILEYAVSSSDQTPGADSTWVNQGSHPFYFAALRGHQYLFRVAARNRWGWGAFAYSPLIRN